MGEIMPRSGILVEADNKGIFVRDRICHIFLARWAIAGQLLIGFGVASEHVKPAM